MALPVASVTVEDACRELIRGIRSGAVRDGRGRQYKPSTVVAYESRLRLHVIPLIGAIPLAALRRGDVHRMVEELAVRESPRTAVSARGVLRVALRRQVELDVIPLDPCVGVRAPTPEDRPARFLTVEEAGRLQSAADSDSDPRIGPVVALALATGMRRGELEALSWGPGGVGPRRRDGPRSGESRRKRQPRSDEEPQDPIRPDRPGNHFTDSAVALASGRPTAGARVFPGWVVAAWERLRAAAKLTGPQPRFHDLRHSAATFLLAAGLRSHAVAELLGHEDAGLFDRLYGHALPDEVNGAGATLDAWRDARHDTF